MGLQQLDTADDRIRERLVRRKQNKMRTERIKIQRREFCDKFNELPRKRAERERGRRII